MPLPTRSRAFRTAMLGVLCGLAVALSFLEGWLPALPLPGAKWGLSNLVTMTALSLFGLPQGLAVTVVKAGFAFFRGGAAGWMSLAGGLCSTLVMAVALRLFPRRLSLVGVSILGAAGHNTGQLLAAMLLFSPALIRYLPWLWLAAGACGLLTGLVTNLIFPALQRNFSLRRE
ncbi:MAG: Gx transporter family protein [Ruminococcaceae bacterium]|nr:Gx transporter family protein [Oscillospiraceae bacterium]